MIAGENVLAIITARGGSKGLPRKNVVEVAGKPLIAWSIEAAQQSQYIDRLILSSEDDEIIETARRFGCDVPFVRPAEYARDDSQLQDAIFHAIESLAEKYSWVIMLPPTAPLRTADDIDACLSLCRQSGAPSAVSVCQPAKSPYWMYKIDDTGHMTRLLEPPGLSYRRQLLPPTYALNGALYVFRTDWFYRSKDFITGETIGYVMPPERSPDVDNWVDLLHVDALLRYRLDHQS